MLTDAFQDCDAGFPIKCRFDAKLFNLKRLRAKSKVQTDVPDKLLYADSLAENVKPEKKCKWLWIECQKHVITITLPSAKKTEIVHQPAPEPTITEWSNTAIC